MFIPAYSFWGLIIVLSFFFSACRSQPTPPPEPIPEPVEVTEPVVVVLPEVLEPVFTIGEIAILKAELINTRFRVAIRIDNPNQFPIELSAFRYELYGNGRFWADGIEHNIISVPGNSSISGNIFLLMNFIDMDRNLLNQIIELNYVNYRFAGQAEIFTGIEYIPVFTTGFDLSGFTRVLGE